MVETTKSMYPQLDNKIQFRVNEINKIKYHFMVEIHEGETISKTLSKNIAAFDYFDNILLVLSAASGSVSFASSASVIGEPIGMTSANFNFALSISNGILKKLLKTTRNKMKKQIKIVLVARSKLNSNRET